MNITGSPLYRKLQTESKEIDELKWLESEKVGGDIGWDHAWWLWVLRSKTYCVSVIYETGKKKI